MPSEMTFRTAFGSWSSALKRAGFAPTKFIPTKNGITRKGTRNKSRKRIINHNGYVQIFQPSHPLAMKNGYVLEHRQLMYDAGLLFNRKLEVNHINKIKTDNRLENLEALTKSYHAKLSTPKGTKRHRKLSIECKYCSTLTASRYQMCRKHYKLEWERGNIKNNKSTNI